MNCSSSALKSLSRRWPSRSPSARAAAFLPDLMAAPTDLKGKTIGVWFEDALDLPSRHLKLCEIPFSPSRLWKLIEESKT